MSDSRKKFDETHWFWEEQIMKEHKPDYSLTPKQAGGIVDKALLSADEELTEDLIILKKWILNRNQ
jgi:hypothetical protein